MDDLTRKRSEKGQGRAPRKPREMMTLVYGLRLFAGRPPAEAAPHRHVPVPAPDGSEDDMALHSIVGATKEEIREQLLESLDAFFELIEPTRK